MTSSVVSLTEQQMMPYIVKARAIQPLIHDVDVQRLLASGLTVLGMKGELFRMVTLEPSWVAEAVARDKHDFDSADWSTRRGRMKRELRMFTGAAFAARSSLPAGPSSSGSPRRSSPSCPPAGGPWALQLSRVIRHRRLSPRLGSKNQVTGNS